MTPDPSDDGAGDVPDVSVWDVAPVLFVLLFLFAGMIAALLWRGM